jgi:monovalent cation/hydrogen antiporter
MPPVDEEDGRARLDMVAAKNAMVRAQFAAVKCVAHDQTGALIHRQLLRRYIIGAAASERFEGTNEQRVPAIASHFDVAIAAIGTGRAELVRLHRERQIDDETLHQLGRDLDLEELAALFPKR